MRIKKIKLEGIKPDFIYNGCKVYSYPCYCVTNGKHTYAITEQQFKDMERNLVPHIINKRIQWLEENMNDNNREWYTHAIEGLKMRKANAYKF